jgi:hypothetical protein
VFKSLYQQAGVQGSTEVDTVFMKTLSSSCKSYKHKAIKIIRGDFLETAWDLLSPNLTADSASDAGFASNTRILYLVRDPRGAVASRSKIALNGDQTALNRDKMMYDMKLTCNKYRKNLAFLQSLRVRNTLPAFRLVRYEDIAYQPLAAARVIYSFLNMTLPNTVIKWISEATMNDYNGTNREHYAYSTARDSKRTAEAWRQYIPYEVARELDTACTGTLQLLGYSLVNDEQTYLNTSVTYVNSIDLEYALRFESSHKNVSSKRTVY